MNKTDQKFLFELLETASPVGYEMPGQRVWAKEMKKHADKVECDVYGSTYATLKGKSKKIVMLESHADEIGFVVKYISKDGFLHIDRLGGSDAATARGKRITLHGDKGEVRGIIGNTAIHIRENLANEKTPKVHELWVDVGADSDKDVAKMGLRVGHPAVFVDGPEIMNKTKIVSRAIDNRIGGYIISRVFQNIAKAKKKPSHTLVGLNSVQEEVGGFGAKMATYRLTPDVIVCFDVTHATDTPGIDNKQHGEVKLGQGPSLRHGGAAHPLVADRIMSVAKKAKINLQHESTSRFSGTDTDKMFDVKTGIPSALVSLPLRSMHSAVETIDMADLDATIKLLTEFVQSLTDKDTFHHKL